MRPLPADKRLARHVLLGKRWGRAYIHVQSLQARTCRDCTQMCPRPCAPCRPLRPPDRLPKNLRDFAVRSCCASTQLSRAYDTLCLNLVCPDGHPCMKWVLTAWDTRAMSRSEAWRGYHSHHLLPYDGARVAPRPLVARRVVWLAQLPGGRAGMSQNFGAFRTHGNLPPLAL